ncbi:GAF domain-containing protein [Halosimplex litoreum]|uniref:histidine kinase n=1 Tax=Halosimplex litoreum TaxID=1198301 RepID=A0A7T3FXJ2_9EURY|nr:ATP-binding protein [Halosimplex litoreum]QPV62553.1 GAF domain-containing protein [Halosimplex litoreum]
MGFEQRQDFARQVADLNKYGQALNQCESVDEVVSLTLEAITILFELTDVTVVEVRNGDLHVVGSTNPEVSAGGAPSEVAREAHETGETVTVSGEAAGLTDDDDTAATLAVPEGIVDEPICVIVVRSSSDEAFGDEVVRPMEILATHAATAISNIRSRERLERARQDLETRKEMVEMYDRLLRHDIGNDLQIIAGFANAVSELVEDERAGEYVGKIERAADNSADLIQRVGDLVSTLEAQNEPDARDLRPLLEDTVRDATDQYESLSVEFDPAEFEHRVYAGDLLDSVFTNVLTNAAVHSDGDVTVDLYAETPAPDRLVVGMADDGSGIDSELREDIFEMGVKGEDSEGTGFGLGFVRALTESYGGGVDVRESAAGGADFRVTLERV